MYKLQKEKEELAIQVANATATVVAPVVETKPASTHSLNLNSKPVLGYWNIRGLGAQIRYLLHYLGVDF